MNRICVSALALAALAGAANAQQIQFRFIERTGQTVATTADSLLEIAVQARVTGGFMLGGFNFNITTNDAESNGTLARARINTGNNQNTYFNVPGDGSSWAANSSVGTGGIAATYSYLAGINADFNGKINLSSGTFTNNPAINEIGLIAGAATGGALLHTPGVDTDGDGNPDTAPSDSGSGGSGIPSNNETAQITDPSIRSNYFGDNNFIDVYRFRYTVSNFAGRTIHFDLGDLGAQFFSQLLFNNGAWGAENTTALPTQISVQGLDITTPTPASVALMGLGGLMVARRRRS